jgi:hypothetical protein
LSKIKSIKTEHPFWGYRRVTAWLRHREGILVNHKAVRKIIKKMAYLQLRQFIKQRGRLKEENLRL